VEAEAGQEKNDKNDMLTNWFHVINIFSYFCRKLREMPGNALKLSGKVREFYFA